MAIVREISVMEYLLKRNNANDGFIYLNKEGKEIGELPDEIIIDGIKKNISIGDMHVLCAKILDKNRN